MQQKFYYYRKFGTSDFIQTDCEKKIVPIRLKNMNFGETLVFDELKSNWEKVDSIPQVDSDTILAEFPEFPLNSQRPKPTGNGVLSKDSMISLEDYSPHEMQNYLDWKKEQERYYVNLKNFVDKNNIRKDYVFAEIIVDDEKFTLTLLFKRFARKELKNPLDFFYNRINVSFPAYSNELPEPPTLLNEKIFFDMKNGKVSFEFDFDGGEKNITNPWNHIAVHYTKEKSKHELFIEILLFLKDFDLSRYPEQILSETYQKYSLLAKKFTGLATTPTTKNLSSDHRPEFLCEMYELTMIPCEPKLYKEVLMSSEFEERHLRFKYSRKDTKVLKKFMRKAHIRNYRTLRKVYAEEPGVLLVYMRLRDCGFRDVNLFNRVIESENNRNVIKKLDLEDLVFFSKYSIKKRGQISTLNLLLKEYSDYYEIRDGMHMFRRYFKHIGSDLRKAILKDGFTRFNHNALSNISYQVENKKINFKYTDEQKNLEDEIDGYAFRLPETSYQMAEIGTALHNCVASYAEQVKKKTSTIVYAKKDGEYKICIELRRGSKPNPWYTVQEKTKFNAQPNDEQKKVLSEWHKRKNIELQTR